MRRKWKYAPSAEKPRFCTECGRRLHKDEVLVCDHCFADLLLSLLTGSDILPESKLSEEDEE